MTHGPWRLAAASLAVLAACGPARDAPQGAPATSLALVARPGTIEGPDRVAAGWTRMTVEEPAGTHLVVAFQVAATMTNADLQAFATALDTAKDTPAGAHAFGGPEEDSATVIVNLPPGRFVLACMTRNEHGHRHATGGEARMFDVVAPVADSGAARSVSPPAETQHVSMVDFAYAGVATWKAGPNILRLTNDGAHDHIMRMARLNPGVTLKQWIDAEDARGLVVNVTGLARMGPGREALVPVTLAPGTYVLYCLIPDAASGKLHLALGMFREIRVE